MAENIRVLHVNVHVVLVAYVTCIYMYPIIILSTTMTKCALFRLFLRSVRIYIPFSNIKISFASITAFISIEFELAE